MRFLAIVLSLMLATPALADNKLIGGVVQDPAVWPASPWVGNCSSTLIGDRVLLTAAHCVSNGGTKSFTIGVTRYTATCTHHPQYSFAAYQRLSELIDAGETPASDDIPVGATQDWALCYVTQPVTGIKFETLAAPSDFACAPGVETTLTGYGCQRWGGGIDGKFRAGKAPVISCPNASGSNADTVTRGNVALCSGDSGGGFYAVRGDKRWVIGVNSRSNTTDTSYLSSTYIPLMRSWALTWANAKGAQICGLTPGATGCRNEGGDEPDPQPSCQDELAAYLAAKQAADGKLPALESCVAAGI